MRWFLVSSIFAFSSMGWAQANRVHDPNQVLNQVDAFAGVGRFEDVLKCDSQARFFAPVQKAELTCDEYGCSATYQTAEYAEGGSVVANCSADAVSIYTDSGQILDITRDSFVANHSNMARIFLDNVANFLLHPGDVTLQSVTPAEYTLASGAKLPAVHVNGEFRLPGAKHAFPLLITVVKNAPGVAQIARLRLWEQTWFRLKEF